MYPFMKLNYSFSDVKNKSRASLKCKINELSSQAGQFVGYPFITRTPCNSSQPRLLQLILDNGANPGVIPYH